MTRPPPTSTLFPYTTLFRSSIDKVNHRMEQTRREIEAIVGDNIYGVNDETLEEKVSALTPRSEEHTSELQSRGHLVCRLLLEKKKRREETTQPNRCRSKKHT